MAKESTEDATSGGRESRRRGVVVLGGLATVLLGFALAALLLIDARPPADADLAPLRSGSPDPDAIARFIAFADAGRKIRLPETVGESLASLDVLHGPKKANWDPAYVATLTDANRAVIADTFHRHGGLPIAFPAADPATPSAGVPDLKAFGWFHRAASLEIAEHMMAHGDETAATARLVELLDILAQRTEPTNLIEFGHHRFHYSRILLTTRFTISRLRNREHAVRIAESLDRLTESRIVADYGHALRGEYAWLKASDTGTRWDSITTYVYGSDGPEGARLVRAHTKRNATLARHADLFRLELANLGRPLAGWDLSLENHWKTWSDGGWTRHLNANAGRAIVAMTSAEIRNARLRMALTVAELGATRVMAALRIHHLDTGVFPARLEDLPSTLLSAIPADPFDGRPLRYSPGPPARLWTVFRDLVDDGGDEGDDRVIELDFVAPP